MKTIEAQQGYLALSQAKLDGLTTEQKYKVLKIARALKQSAKDFEDFIKDVQEKVTDVREQNKILSKEADRDVEINIEKLGEVFDKLLEVNDWNVAQTLLLDDLIH